MTLLDHINGALQGFLTGAGKLWHQSMEPWLSNLLSTVSKAEVSALAPIASEAVAELGTDLLAAHGNLSQFSTVAGQVLANTAQKAEAASITAAGTSLFTAVDAAIAGHIAANPPATVDTSAQPAS